MALEAIIKMKQLNPRKQNTKTTACLDKQGNLYP